MRRVVLAYLPVTLWAAGVLGLGSLTLESTPLASGMDKAAHFLLYGVGGALAGWARFRSGRGSAWLMLPLIAAIAAIDEVNQGSVRGRVSDAWDWAADVAGALTFYLITWRLLQRREGRG